MFTINNLEERAQSAVKSMKVLVCGGAVLEEWLQVRAEQAKLAMDTIKLCKNDKDIEWFTKRGVSRN